MIIAASEEKIASDEVDGKIFVNFPVPDRGIRVIPVAQAAFQDRFTAKSML